MYWLARNVTKLSTLKRRAQLCLACITQPAITRLSLLCDSNGWCFVFVQDVKLSPEVEPFIPQRKGLEGSIIGMSLSGEAGGGGGIGGGSGGVEATSIPSYLITCYPFVQENQPSRYLYNQCLGRGQRSQVLGWTSTGVCWNSSKLS